MVDCARFIATIRTLLLIRNTNFVVTAAEVAELLQAIGEAVQAKVNVYSKRIKRKDRWRLQDPSVRYGFLAGSDRVAYATDK